MGEFLEANIRSMRAACRKFLDELDPATLENGFNPNHQAGWVFNTALGEFRGVMGQLVGVLAETHRIQLEPQLERITPLAIEDDAERDPTEWFWDRFS